MFEVKAPTAIEAVRINLLPPLASNPPVAYLKLYSICAVISGDNDPGNDVVLTNLHDADQLQQRATVTGLELNKKHLGELYVVDAVDPSITIDFAPAAEFAPPQTLQVTVSLEYLFSDEYLLARDLFLVNQEQLQKQVRSLEVDVKEMRDMKNALAAYQESPLWRGFVFFHQLYERFRSKGVMRACSRVFQPDWWTRQDQTDYENWRNSNGYENRKQP